MSLKQIQTLVAKAQIKDPARESLALLSHLTALPKGQLLADNFELDQKMEAELRQLIAIRQELPLAYITQEKEFYGLSFRVSQHVFIPRAESEDMIEIALQIKTPFQDVYDLGCGSGCLGIAYAHKKKAAVTFIDKNPRALALCRFNARQHQIKDARFVLADLNQQPTSFFKKESLFLANPPYLDLRKKGLYEKNCPTLKSEPPEALYEKEGGLKLYRLLFQQLPPSATILCETLPEQQRRLRSLARINGWQHLQSRNLISVFTR